MCYTSKQGGPKGHIPKTENNKKIFFKLLFTKKKTVHLHSCTVHGTWTMQEALG